MEALIGIYEGWPFDEATFYQLRALKFEDLPPSEAAARTLYLNRGCFNGLYRVNRSGAFNVPWGRYKQPYRIDRGNFAKARDILKGAKIVLGDFRDVLRTHAESGDFIFLDPPYVPISEFADFKRYTRDQFQNDDHTQMAVLAKELAERGCDVLITNSNHPLVHDLYRDYQIEVVPTKRNVNSRGSGRSGEDTVIYVSRS